jgi:hypothetical protein
MLIYGDYYYPFFLGLPFIVLMTMDALTSPDCLEVFLTMGGVQVHMMYPPTTKFFRNGQRVSVGKTGVFVGNMEARDPGEEVGTAVRICVHYLSVHRI